MQTVIIFYHLLLFVEIRITIGKCLSDECVVHHMPISRNETKAEGLIRLGKFDELNRIHQIAASTGIGNQQLSDYYDSEYIGTIAVGTPPVNYAVLMDTGSSDLWLADSSCKDCAGMSPTYNVKKSSSSISSNYEWSIEYGSGSAEGYIVTDKVCIGSTLCFQKQIFGRATYVDPSFQNSGFTGLLGLGWPSISAIGVVPLVQNILPQFNQPIFTVWLNSVGPESSTGLTTYGGAITFGGHDTAHCSSTINFVPLTATTYWQFTLSGISVGNYKLTTTTWQAISDTGTSLIYGPSTIVAKMAKEVGAVSKGGYYIMPCSGTFPSVTLTIGSHLYTIPSSIYIYAVGNGKCMFGFMPNLPGDNGWILGDPWIRAYCNIYDIGNKRIGFAQTLTTSGK